MLAPIWTDTTLDRAKLEISDDLLEDRSRRIVPLVKKDGKLYRIEQPHLRNTAYTWEPKLLKQVEDYQELFTSKTMHSCGYHAFFKPSIAEVLAQADVIEPWANGFYIMNEREIDMCTEGEGHIATVMWVRIR